jgi:hypothetical protein
MSTVTQRLDEISSLLIRLVPDPPHASTSSQQIPSSLPQTSTGRPLSELYSYYVAETQTPKHHLPDSPKTHQAVTPGGRMLSLPIPHPGIHHLVKRYLNGQTARTIALYPPTS